MLGRRTLGWVTGYDGAAVTHKGPFDGQASEPSTHTRTTPPKLLVYAPSPSEGRGRVAMPHVKRPVAYGGNAAHAHEHYIAENIWFPRDVPVRNGRAETAKDCGSHGLTETVRGRGRGLYSRIGRGAL